MAFLRLLLSLSFCTALTDFGAAQSWNTDRQGVYLGPLLNWVDDPTTTMTVTWLEINGMLGTHSWRIGPAGFGYGDDDDTTELNDMKNNYARIYLRKEVDLDGVGKDGQLGLHIRYDDGFIAYLNGQEVARRGIGSGRGFLAADIASHEGNQAEFVAFENWQSRVRENANFLAIEGHNSSLDSSDFTLEPTLAWLPADQDAPVPVGEQNNSWFYLAGGEPHPDWNQADFDPNAKDKLTQPAASRNSVLHYRKTGTDDWLQVQGFQRPFGDTDNVVRFAEIRNLDPGQSYELSIGTKAPSGTDVIYKFQTAPEALTQPVQFVAGGDMYHHKQFLNAMNAQAGKQNPLFALLGGDLAYANGTEAGRWYHWIDSWVRNARSSDTGCLIPMIVAIGNHEVGNSNSLKPERRAKFFYNLFPLKGRKSYYALDFGTYLSVVVLDSDHTTSVSGPQSQWLANVLRERQMQQHVFACYHRPAFGTTKKSSDSVRRHWVPLFERFGLDAAFENDHHTYKRTHPILNGKVNYEEGVLYIGDGAWGVDLYEGPTLPDESGEFWYLAKTEGRRHLIKVTLDGSVRKFQAIDADGNIFDRYPVP